MSPAQTRLTIAAAAVLCLAATATAQETPGRPIAAGKFRPDWESLKQYECPKWFRDAKFGIWAHWTAQCVPEQGDWYARSMYQEGTPDYDFQVAHYGHPSKVGFKDLDNAWKAEHWDPEALIKLYKRAGARYFVALANHHDNFDCFDSTYQPWNSVRIGPKKDIVGTWAKLARKYGLHFGVTNHSSQAWHWFQVAYGHDTQGPLAGVPYDGRLTKADGKGTWWEGLDPQELYTGSHFEIPADINTPRAMRQWMDQINGRNWSQQPPNDPAYVTKWFNRTKDLIDKYNPDLLYFDDTLVPLGEAGMNIYAHYYNANMRRHGGKLEAVLNVKGVPADKLKCLVHDFERGQSDRVEPSPWQTDTCIGDWHYRRSLFEKHQYKTPRQVIHMLADIVSKNGNLLLNIPLRGDGTIDEDERKFLDGMAAWMDINSEAIFGTRPFVISGEGRTRNRGGQFSEGGPDRFTGEDFRFTTKGNTLYAIAMEWPGRQAVIRSLATGSPLVTGEVRDVKLLGCAEKLVFKRTPDGLAIQLPTTKPCDHAYTFKVTGVTPVPGSAATALASAAPVIQADPGGSIRLTADAATMHGNKIKTEAHGDIVNIGFWDDPQEWASWDKVQIDKPGTYEVRVQAASPQPTEMTITVGDRSVALDVPATGGWDQFREVSAGSVDIANAGRIVVKAAPRTAAAWKPVNLATITLRPKAQPR